MIEAMLRAEGIATWRDNRLGVGDSWRDVIADNLQNSAAVLVLWSAAALESRHVLAEAEASARLEKYFPVLLETVEPPKGLRSVQSADLTRWGGGAAAPEWRDIVASQQAAG